MQGCTICALHTPPLEGETTCVSLTFNGAARSAGVVPCSAFHNGTHRHLFQIHTIWWVAPCRWLISSIRPKVGGSSSLLPSSIFPPPEHASFQSAKCAIVSCICHNYFTDVLHLSFIGMIFLLFLRKRMFVPELVLRIVGSEVGAQGHCYSQTLGASSGTLGDIVTNPLAFSEIVWILWNSFSWKYFQRMLKIHCSLFSSVGSICVPTWPGNTKRANVKFNAAHSKINLFSVEQGEEKTTDILVWFCLCSRGEVSALNTFFMLSVGS